MGDYLLGLDAGNTVIKAIIFDLDGRELAHAAREGHSHMPRPGHVERDLGEFWEGATAEAWAFPASRELAAALAARR